MSYLADRLSLYLVTDENIDLNELLSTVESALKGGTRVVQLREKHSNTKEFLLKASLMMELISRYDALLIINDRLDIALAVGAHGIHVGQNDMPVTTLKRLTPSGFLIGLSIENMNQLEEANSYDLSYVALSPVFPTNTKKGFESHWGIDGIMKAKLVSRHPIIAIGGITLQNVGEIINEGACGVAVISAIFTSPDPQETTAHFLDKIQQAKHDGKFI